MSADDETITELEEFEPSRVDGVGKGANGFPILMLKSIDGEVTEIEATLDDVLDELDKADGDDRPPCTLCHGDGKIKDGHVTCPKCKGSGVKPMPGDTEKSLRAIAVTKESGVAASGADVDADSVCGHCKGSGQDGTGVCDACAGTGKDGDAPAKSELNMVDADAGNITVGAGGRETVDKSADEVSKKDMDPNVGGGVDRDKIPAEDFAGKDRSFPIVTAGDVSDALQSIGRAGSDNYDAATLRANIVKIAKRKGFSVPADAEKADGTFTAPNPALAAAATQVTDSGDDDGDASSPGSPAWEAVDAQTATDAAMALMTAAELIREFAQREMQEVVAGEGNDVFDAGAAQQALCGVSSALGIMAQMAFHEGLEAAKSLPDDEAVEKAGKRLSTKSVSALAAARDHLTQLLGDDDPAKDSNDNGGKSATDNFIDSANKALLSKEIDDMTADELLRLLDERDAQKAADKKASKGKQDVDNTDSIAAGKDANNKAKTKDPKADDKDLEDEADQGDNDSASSPATGAAKADGDDAEVELTPEQIEARDAAKAAKKAAKAAKREQEALDQKIALTKSIEESLAKVVEQNEVLKSTVETLTTELDGVKKMAAPSNGAVRTAPVEAQNIAKARDEVELRIATLEREARETSDPTIRSGNREMITDLRKQLSDKN